jgi:hypothetical protein
VKEEWRDIADFPKYEVSNTGRVRRKAWDLVPGSIPSGHLTVALSNGSGKPRSQYVHRLVAQAFIENTDSKPLVNHRNGNPKDNRLVNLEWSTYSENITHGYRVNGRRTPFEMKVVALDGNGQPVMSFRSGADAARLMGVETSAIWSAVRREGTCSGYRWVRYADTI